jgi:cbb3-type cytochrome oxidase maturation protein
MEIIYMLIAISLVLVGVMAWALLWAVRSGQFDDLEGPAHRILMEEDEYSHLHSEHSVTPPQPQDKG